MIQGIDMTAKVLTVGLWKNTQSTTCKLPEELKVCAEKFTQYYELVHTGRKLCWTAHLGDCEVETTCYPRKYTLLLNVYQTTILMLYNEADSFSFQELAAKSMLPTDLLAFQLYNLTHPQQGKLLLKEKQ